MPIYDADLEAGLQLRRSILGDAWVEQSLGSADDFTADFQNFITRFAWNEIWSRPGIDPRTRRIIVLAITASMGRWEEFDLHIRAALTAHRESGPQTGLSPAFLRELLLQVAVYAGVPAANTAMKHVRDQMRHQGLDVTSRNLFEARRSGARQSFMSRGRPAIHYSLSEPLHGAASAPTLVLSHALGLDAGMWEELVAGLGDTCRILSYDHRGHGRSELAPGPWTDTELAEDAILMLREVRDRGVTGPFIWVGVSLGGMVGQRVAAMAPELIDALVIANACCAYPEAAREGWRQRIATVQAAGLAAVADASIDRWFSPHFQQTWPARVERWKRRLLATPVDGYLHACHAVMNLQLTTELDKIHQPALIIAGALDAATPPAMSQQIVAGMRQARYQLIEGVAHLSVIEDAATFARHVQAFVQSLKH